MPDKKALYWQKHGRETACLLCPHTCIIKEGQFGLCNARQNVGGTLISKSYGAVSALNVDPVEKKPLFHFYPGSTTLSFGSFGCNFKCGFCQNYDISFSKPNNDMRFMPADAAYFAVEKNIKLISYTYNEPFTDYEWVYEMSELARKKSMQNILITNGYIKKEPLKRLAAFTDAANVDFKAYDDNFYKKHCGGSLKPVLETIEELYAAKVYIELTNLIIDGENSDPEAFGKMLDFIVGIDNEIPLHISKYFPSYQFSIAQTSEKTLYNLYNIAKEKLKYVYLGNMDSVKHESTYCKQCGFCLIERKGYNITINCKNPRICPECGIKNNIII